MNLLESIRASALLRDERHLRRTRRVHYAREGVWAQVSGQRLLNFSSND